MRYTKSHMLNIKHKVLAVGVAVLVVIILILGMLYKLLYVENGKNFDIHLQEVSNAEPVDIVMDFYNPWLDALVSTSTNPYTSGFATAKILGKELQEHLQSKEGHADTEIDPVLCQTTRPETVTGRIVSQTETETRVLVLSKDKTITAQSVFTLTRHNDGWFIEDIECFAGEFAPEREFSFEKEGYLLKSVPPPLNAEHWHIVFEEDGELGHFAPLFFNADSACLAPDKSESVCSPDQFTEATKVRVYGQMTESGVEVKRIEFVD